MPKRYKGYDSFLIFQDAVTAGPDKVYGALFNSRNYPRDRQFFQIFTEYLCGVHKWIEELGNSTNAESKNWIDKETGKAYGLNDEYVIKFSRQAYEEKPIQYKYKEKFGKIDYKEDDLSGSYIISERLWRKLKKLTEE